MKFLRGTKTPPLSGPFTRPESPKAVITCEACGTNCRVPADRGTIRVTCPGCQCQGLWSPPAPATETKPSGRGPAREYPEQVRITHTCKARGGVAILTFRRSGLLGKASYRLYRVETLPLGSGPAAIGQARNQSDDPDTFPDDLIDWSDVACPHCHAPVSQIIACGTCRTMVCVSGITMRKGRQYLTCLCGSHGPLETVDVVILTQTGRPPAREDTQSPAPSPVPRLGYQRSGSTGFLPAK